MIREWPLFNVDKVSDFALFYIAVVVVCCVLVIYKLIDKLYGD